MKNIYIIITLSYLSAQMPYDCLFNKASSLNRSELQSNAIIDIRNGLENELYIGTGDSLGYADITDPLSPIFSIVRDELLPEGGIPALKTYKLNNNKIMIVLSGAISTYEIADNECHPRGTGISWSVDSGVSWQHINQPVDEGEPGGSIPFQWYGKELSKKVWHTTVDNVSYDVAVDTSRNFIYSASWGGGLRRFNYTDDNPEWEIIPLPMDDQDSLFWEEIDEVEYYFNPVDPPDGSDNHKAFSAYVDLDTVWVGTAGGVNKGLVQTDGRIDWIHYNKDNGLGGNWIVGIIPQEFDSRLWLISWISPNSPHPLTYTNDGGKTWNIVTQLFDMGIIVYNLSFSSKYILASTDHGLYYSNINDGKFWMKMPIADDISGERILSDKFFTAITIGEGDIDTLLIGTEDGLSIISTDGETMENIRFRGSSNSFSVYPNPFFINSQNLVGDNGHIRFNYSNSNTYSGKIDVFDFAMDQVIHLDNSSSITLNGENEIIWNGRNQYGDKVANGVYFCRLSLNGKYYWTKLAVIN